MNGELPKADSLEDKVFSVINEESFYSIALQVYHFQYHNNPVYQAWCDLLHRPPARVRETSDIPYLPIRFFKHIRLQVDLLILNWYLRAVGRPVPFLASIG